MSEVRASSFTLSSDDEKAIHVRSWLPSGEPTAVVQIAHGMAEHGARYAALAEAIVGRGWAAYANDHRGHGQSIPDGEPPGDMGEDGFSRAAADLFRLKERICELHPRVPLVFLGHSMGSFLGQRLVADHGEGFSAIVLSSSNGKPPPIAKLGRLVARAERLRLGPLGRSKVLDALSFGDFNRKFRPNRTEFDWLSRDEVEVDKYVADPLCGFSVTTQSWVSLLDSLEGLTAIETLERIPKDVPIYLFSGDHDPVGDMGRGVRRLADAYRESGVRSVDLRLYRGGRHEMLHELNRAEVIEELLAWLGTALARRQRD
jgi:alpha-beta hydrolase superfamily lysophospholipase